jgi:putative membrane protein
VNRYQASLLALLTVALIGSCIRAPYPQEMYLQHAPTVAALVAAPWLLRRWPLSDRAWTCIAAFLLLHTLGARYIYSNVPYDRWALLLLGHDLTATFGLRRNHYDRLVHFAFGLLSLRPVREIGVRHLRLTRRFAGYQAFAFVMTASALYEIFEWGLTFALAPEDAGAYNGEQGDAWDAQKDMALALAGTAVSFLFKPAKGADVRSPRE